MKIAWTFESRRVWGSVLGSLGAFPMLLASVALKLLGFGDRARQLDTWSRRHWLGAEPGPSSRSTWRWWVAAPIALLTSGIMLYLVTGIVINLAYPLRSDSGPSDWGGPSLIGRWLVHGAGAVLFAAAALPICAGLRWVARRSLMDVNASTRTKV